MSIAEGISAIVTASESVIPQNQAPFALVAGVTVAALFALAARLGKDDNKETLRK